MAREMLRRLGEGDHMAEERHHAERLSPADASNVVMDAADQVNCFLMAGILGSGGFVGPDGAVDLVAIRDRIARRLAEASDDVLRRFTQRVGTEGRALVWQPAEPDLSWHVRQVGPVVGREGLADLCATLMTTPLPRDRPLWEVLIVPGAGVTGPGIILRIHHAVADGVAGVRLAPSLFDPVTPNGASGPDQPSPSGHPGALATARPATHRRNRWKAFRDGVVRVAAMFRSTVAPTVLLGPIGPHRGVAFADVDLSRFAAAAKGAGGRVNDALLAAVAAAVTTTLRAAGEPVPPTLPASVPVALPDRGTSGNAVGIMLAPLPTSVPDSADRVAAIAALTGAAKAAARTQGTYELTRTRWGSRLMAALARRQRFVALFVTNVRGPARQMTLAGAPLLQVWPVAAIQGNVRFGVAAVSYAGRLGVAAHIDADALDLDRVRRALEDELHRIAALG